MKLFSIYDTAMELYNRPLGFKTVAEAIRTFVAMEHELDSLPSKHPKDFVLFEIGSMDDSTGVLTPFVSPKRHGSLEELCSKGA